MVTWGTVANKPSESTEASTTARTSEDTRVDFLTPDPSRDRLSLSYPDGPSSNTELQDESTRFENAKQKKTTLMEGIKKFNVKPKKVSYFDGEDVRG